METVIGLEIHAQLLTETKLFCDCSADYFGKEPNTNTCPVCLGLPGALPVLNETAVEYGIRAALALSCDIPDQSKFDRKNYFYPDLPKGYQISQYDEPLAVQGSLELEGDSIRIRRIHLEEDAGKLIHRNDNRSSVDLNRVGTPLIEIVTEPDLTSPTQAKRFVELLRQTLRYIDVCDGDMETGSLRCDANLSIKEKGTQGTKTEVKNMNSFKAVQKALEFEQSRQKQLLENGESIQQETLTWNSDQEVAMPMRSKEEAHDYRYFPEPDLVPLRPSEDWKDDIRRSLPELPQEKKQRWEQDFQLPEYDIEVLTEDKRIARYFEETVEAYNAPKSVSNWMMSQLMRVLKDQQAELDNVSPSNFARLVAMVDDDKVNQNTAKEVLEESFKTGTAPQKIIDDEGLSKISDRDKLQGLVEQVLDENGDAVEDYKNGKDQVLGFLIGQLMQKTDGQADPGKARELLQQQLNQK